MENGQTDPLIGQELEGYRILEVIGRGGMGVVYKAEDVALSMTVALKMIDSALGRDKSFLRRFRSEARALARIDSPHIVDVHALRQTDEGTFIVMEYVEGVTLADKLEDGPIPWQQAVPLMRQMLMALADAHAAGVTHRDIKPGNIMLTSSGTVKVTDFGLAKVRSEDTASTVTEATAGTVKYMSPEQVRGLRHVDDRSDLYSLGMTVYEMVAGRLPFEPGSSTYTIMRTIVDDPIPAPDNYSSDLPDRLVQIVMKSLEKEPARRFSSAEEMLTAVEGLETEVESPPSGTWTRRTLAAVIVLLLISGGYGLYRYGGLLDHTDDVLPDAPITISTRPQEATVYLNGARVGTTNLTNYRLGGRTAALRIERNGYPTIDTVISRRNGEWPALDFSLSPSFASLLIEVAPTDASLHINGRALDRVARTIDRVESGVLLVSLAPGNFELIAQKEGYREWRRQVKLAAGGRDTLQVELVQEPPPTPTRGRLVLESGEGGQLLLDGNAVETGEHRLDTGQHMIFCQYASYRANTSITIRADQTQTVTCYTEQTVTILSRPVFAFVRVNGENRGRIGQVFTAEGVKVTPGRYEVEVYLDEYEVTGGTYRTVSGDTRSPEQKFAGATYTIDVTPSFEEKKHQLVFELQKQYNH